MKDLTEKDEQLQPETSDASKKQPATAEESNVNEHHQIDEEGNQVDPEDVK